MVFGRRQPEEGALRELRRLLEAEQARAQSLLLELADVRRRNTDLESEVAEARNALYAIVLLYGCEVNGAVAQVDVVEAGGSDRALRATLAAVRKRGGEVAARAALVVGLLAGGITIVDKGQEFLDAQEPIAACVVEHWGTDWERHQQLHDRLDDLVDEYETQRQAEGTGAVDPEKLDAITNAFMSLNSTLPSEPPLSPGTD